MVDGEELDTDTFRALEEAAARVRALAEVGEVLAFATPDIDETLNRITFYAADLIGETCSLALLTEDGASLKVAAFHDVNPAGVAAYREHVVPRPIPLSSGLGGQVVMEGRPVFMPVVSRAELQASSNPVYHRFLENIDVGSVMAVPLRDRGQIIGVIGMTRSWRARPYKPADLTFLLDLATRAGSAIANARMFGRLQSELENRIRAQAALRSAEARLASSQKMEALGRLAACVAHDFNNLLSAIGLMGSDLSDGRVGEREQREMGQQLETAVQSGGSLTRQLLAFGKAQQLNLQAVDVGEPIRRTISLLARLLPSPAYALELSIAEGTPDVLVDPGQLEQVFVNLATNARDAMPEGGKLAFSVTCPEVDELESERLGLKPGKHVRIDVADTGIGMDAATRSHIFEPFFTTRASVGGNGLGLSSVHGIVNQSGGMITVTSEVGKGTIFSIFLRPAY